MTKAVRLLLIKANIKTGGDLMKLIDLVMTTAEIMEEYEVNSRSNLVKAIKNEWKAFKLGENCRQAGKTWLVTREAVDQSYEKN